MFLSRTCLAILASFALTASAMTEPATGIDFAARVSDNELPGAGTDARIAGTGVRVKKIGPISAKVYAVGLYVDERAVQSQLKSFEAFPEESLVGSKAFYKAVRKAPFDKIFQLKMARTVGAEKMVNALAESVKPRMKGEYGALSQFQELLSAGLSGGSCTKNTAFGFAATNKGKLVVSINGKERGVVASKELCDALTDTYIGEAAVSPDAKKSFGRGLCAMLKGQ